MRLSIGSKLRLVAFAAVVLITGTQVAAVWGLVEFSRAIDSIAELRDRHQRCEALRFGVTDVLMQPHDFRLRATHHDARARFRDDVERLRRAIDAPGGLLGEHEGAADANLAVLEARGLEIFDVVDRAGDQAAAVMLDMDDAARRLAEVLTAVSDELHRQMDASDGRAEAMGKYTVRLMLVAGLGAVLAIFLGTALVGRSMIRRLGKLTAGVTAMGGGDLTTRVVVDGGDEISELGRQFNTMAERLQQAQQELKRAERMAAIGEMAVTMRHEINNPLQAIVGAASLLSLPPEKRRSGDQAETIRALGDACLELSERVRRLGNLIDAPSTEYINGIRMLDVERGQSRSQ